MRSLPPLPASRTVFCPRSTSSTARPTASEMRAPVPYSSSSRARSRSPRGPSTEPAASISATTDRSEEHTSELQSRQYLVCRLLLEKKKDPLDEAQHHDGRESRGVGGTRETVFGRH